MVAWGGAEALHQRIAAFVAAGADHVAIIPLGADGITESIDVLEALAG